MAFDPSRLVPSVPTKQAVPVDSGPAFDPSRLTPSKEISPEDLKAIRGPSALEVGLSQGAATLADWLIPDEVMNVIRTGDGMSVHQPTTLASMLRPEENQANRELIAEGVGVDLRDPSELGSGFEKSGAAVIEGLVDPLTYSGPLKAGVAGATSLVKRGLQSVFPTAVAERAASVAQETAQEKGYGQFGQSLAALAGGITGGVSTGVIQTPVAFGLKTGGRAISGTMHRIKNKGDVEGAFADTQIKLISRAALESQPELIQMVGNAKVMAERLGVPELKIGRIATLAANDHLRRDFRTFYQTNAGFRDSVDSAVTEYNDLVKDFKGQFGGGTAAQTRQIGKAVNTERAKVVSAQEKKTIELNNRQASIEDELQAVSDNLFEQGDSVESGRKIRMLQSAQETTARKKQSLVYNEILGAATEQGLEMASTGSAALHKRVKELNFKELFGDGNKISSRINRFFSPRVSETTAPRTLTPSTGLAGSRGIPVAPKTIKTNIYPSVGIEQIDSLKKELNAELRRNDLSPSQYTTLKELKATLDDQIVAMDPDFSAAYKAADRAYMENVGIPFNEAGVQSISRAKFAQDASAKIMKPEIAQQFLDVAGEEGTGVLRHAVMVQLSQKLFKGGKINPRAVNTWLDNADNKKLLGMVPGLEEELRNSSTVTDTLLDDLSMVDSQRNANMYHQTDDLFKSLDSNINKVVSEILGDRTKLNQHMKTLNGLAPENRVIVQNGLRAALIEKAMGAAGNSGTSILDFVKDKQNREAFTRLFGKKYVKDLESLATLGDMKESLGLDSMDFAIGRQEREIGKESLGVTPSGATALIRRPIISRTQKVFIAMSLIGSKQVANLRDEQLMNLLLNEKALSTLGDSITIKDGVAVFKKGGKEALLTLATSAGKGAYFGTREGLSTQTQEQQ